MNATPTALQGGDRAAGAAADKAAIRREVIRLAWPLVLQNSFRTVFFIVDTAILGRYSWTAMASIAIAAPLMHTLITVLMALSVGTIAIISRAVGEKNHAKAKSDGGTIMLSALCVGVVIALAGQLLIPSVVAFFHAKDPVVVAGATGYLRIMTLFLPVMAIELVASSMMRAAGDTWAAMVTGAVGNALNIALNFVFIYGMHIGPIAVPEMGVRGSALATGLSISAQAVMMTAFLLSSRSPLRFSFKSLYLSFSFDSLRKLVRVSLPAAIEPVIMQSGMLIMARMVTSFGEVSMAAHRAAIAMESLSYMPGMGFSLACAALVGQKLGAGRPDEAARSLKETAKISTLIMSALGVVYLAVPKLLIGISTSNAEVLELGAWVMMIAALSQPTMSLSMVFQGMLRGAGDTRSPVLVAFIGVWLVRVPLSYLLGVTFHLGLAGMWMTMVVDWTVRAAVLWMIYRRGRWKRIEL